MRTQTENQTMLTRRSLFGLTAGVAAAATITGVATSAGRADATAANLTFKAVTYNLNTGGNRELVRQDLSRLAQAGIRLVGLNEMMGPEAAAVQAWADARRQTWGYYRPAHVAGRSEFSRSNAILYRRDVFKRLSSGEEFGNDSHTQFRQDVRWMTWAYLQHRGSGATFTWIQTHMDPGTQPGPGGAPNEGQRIEDNRLYMKHLLELVRNRATEGEVMVGGDWNVSARLDRQYTQQDPNFPYNVLEHRGDNGRLPALRSTFTMFGFEDLEVRGNRRKWIDYVCVWHRQSAADRVLTVSSHRVLGGYHSDHRPIRVVVQIHRDRL